MPSSRLLSLLTHCRNACRTLARATTRSCCQSSCICVTTKPAWLLQIAAGVQITAAARCHCLGPGGAAVISSICERSAGVLQRRGRCMNNTSVLLRPCSLPQSALERPLQMQTGFLVTVRSCHEWSAEKKRRAVAGSKAAAMAITQSGSLSRLIQLPVARTRVPTHQSRQERKATHQNVAPIVPASAAAQAQQPVTCESLRQ